MYRWRSRARQLPDVMIVEDRETLQQLAESGMIAELGDAYENCASKGLKEMYASYEGTALQNAVVDGKLMALPEPCFVDGPLLLWLRQDWMEKLAAFRRNDTGCGGYRAGFCRK